jgi:hypothetical protein
MSKIPSKIRFAKKHEWGGEYAHVGIDGSLKQDVERRGTTGKAEEKETAGAATKEQIWIEYQHAKCGEEKCGDIADLKN